MIEAPESDVCSQRYTSEGKVALQYAWPGLHLPRLDALGQWKLWDGKTRGFRLGDRQFLELAYDSCVLAKTLEFTLKRADVFELRRRRITNPPAVGQDHDHSKHVPDRPAVDHSCDPANSLCWRGRNNSLGTDLPFRVRIE